MRASFVHWQLENYVWCESGTTIANWNLIDLQTHFFYYRTGHILGIGYKDRIASIASEVAK